MSKGSLEFVDLIPYQTGDGSFSLRSINYKENFHSIHGAITEAKEKFLRPAELERFNNEKKIHVLDVCLGIGYNTACILEDPFRLRANPYPARI